MTVRLALLLLLLTLMPAQAWRNEGHQLVALIALDQLNESQFQNVQDILAHHPDPSIRTLQQAAIWPDLIEEPDHPFHHLDRPDWHYSDRPIPETEGQEFKGQLVEQVKHQTRIFQDPKQPKSRRAVALSWLTHLMGDIHQPLHNVSFHSDQFPRGDRGGNRFKVTLNTEFVPLHVFWDTAGGRFPERAPAGRVEGYARRFQMSHPKSDFREELQLSDPQAWSWEGVEIARDIIYPKVRHRTKVSPEVLLETLEITELRLTLAGYRLGQLLK